MWGDTSLSRRELLARAGGGFGLLAMSGLLAAESELLGEALEDGRFPRRRVEGRLGILQLLQLADLDDRL